MVSLILYFSYISRSLAYFCLSWDTWPWSCTVSDLYWSSSTFFEFITFTICYFYCPNEKISFLYFLLSDSIEINLSWRAPFYFLVWSRSCIIFWIWLTVSINFFSIPWYWLNLDSNFWNTSLRAWIYLIFSEIIPLIRSIYFVRFIYFCLWILISYWIWVNVLSSLSKFWHFF